MKETARVVDGKEIKYKVFSKRERREIVSAIERDEICVEDAAEKAGVTYETVKKWITMYSKTLIVDVKHRLPEEIKKATVRDIEAGLITIGEATRRLNVQYKAIQQWMEKYSFQVEEPQKGGFIIKKDRKTSKEIENLKLKVAALETMIDVAEKELKINIRKKRGTKRSL